MVATGVVPVSYRLKSREIKCRSRVLGDPNLWSIEPTFRLVKRAGSFL